MDFMKWLNSLDELLYEVISWLIFYPVTLGRTLLHPIAMMGYADRQLALPQEQQYGAALSPPLFLALTLSIAHLGATALGETDQLVANRHGLSNLIDDDASALAFRLLIFSIFPLLMSLHFVWRRRLPLDRNSLRLPFYAQCYPAAIFALGLSFGTMAISLKSAGAQSAGAAIIVLAILFYLLVEARWFAVQFRTGLVRGAATASAALIEGATILVGAGLLLGT
ncbi:MULTISPECIES: hypothetical protein [unclassified Sphingomonas]|uniref:hypothetical protein n=2 Tax=Sphingomonas TaxID=13687 RepID=UPI0006FB8DF2|nr:MULTISPECIES: hypothetical protein [unclassified Sphingomonas]KQX20705.1 hypothetical protein ASD17_07320 [Sphingomonas sp. Root1294]KQY68551.1 hypothetical protein ASD39_03840 [Sphingomonas sp. Root50]KRB87957.1 hypothetical protein ASE22_21015 [Sphingomonas sp. Root720]